VGGAPPLASHSLSRVRGVGSSRAAPAVSFARALGWGCSGWVATASPGLDPEGVAKGALGPLAPQGSPRRRDAERVDVVATWGADRGSVLRRAAEWEVGARVRETPGWATW